MFGFINLNKPAGFTSHDCIAKLRKFLNTRKIGHGGTLDPAATGVLPVAVGKATRLLQFLPEPKAYRALIRLGVTTTTDDLEGEVIKSVAEVNLEPEEITAALNNFVGTIEQVPPIYSAIKQKGKKLYELARKGEDIAVEPRIITITKIELLNIYRADFYELEVKIHCGSGTYIRAIARDLGQMLGVGGTLANLVRTESCGMQLENSITLEQIASQLQQQTFALISPSLVFNHLERVTLAEEESIRWCQGQLIDLAAATTCMQPYPIKENSYLVTYRADQAFLGISILIQRDNIFKLKPKIVLHQ
ncbi:tRNA pseudouridine(55) synthase TruB [Pleurocapsa sp. PCC 7319]|uniref:tRNA pseudouridine(55) synthase TruB n=1 Tax=Pleurocapsa sp. PCC 7319 TaxID=118161 RepID=UPI0003479281|nr:tRNA pseudouridine(55) synthase TruB [Pleurocapsa sp. PCC 7319]